MTSVIVQNSLLIILPLIPIEFLDANADIEHRAPCVFLHIIGRKHGSLLKNRMYRVLNINFYQKGRVDTTLQGIF